MINLALTETYARVLSPFTILELPIRDKVWRSAIDFVFSGTFPEISGDFAGVAPTDVIPFVMDKIDQYNTDLVKSNDFVQKTNSTAHTLQDYYVLWNWIQSFVVQSQAWRLERIQPDTFFESTLYQIWSAKTPIPPRNKYLDVIHQMSADPRDAITIALQNVPLDTHKRKDLLYQTAILLVSRAHPDWLRGRVEAQAKQSIGDMEDSARRAYETKLVDKFDSDKMDQQIVQVCTVKLVSVKPRVAPTKSSTPKQQPIKKEGHAIKYEQLASRWLRTANIDTQLQTLDDFSFSLKTSCTEFDTAWLTALTNHRQVIGKLDMDKWESTTIKVLSDFLYQRGQTITKIEQILAHDISNFFGINQPTNTIWHEYCLKWLMGTDAPTMMRVQDDWVEYSDGSTQKYSRRDYWIPMISAQNELWQMSAQINDSDRLDKALANIVNRLDTLFEDLSLDQTNTHHDLAIIKQKIALAICCGNPIDDIKDYVNDPNHAPHDDATGDQEIYEWKIVLFPHIKQSIVRFFLLN